MFLERVTLNTLWPPLLSLSRRVTLEFVQRSLLSGTNFDTHAPSVSGISVSSTWPNRHHVS